MGRILVYGSYLDSAVGTIGGDAENNTYIFFQDIQTGISGYIITDLSPYGWIESAGPGIVSAGYYNGLSYFNTGATEATVLSGRPWVSLVNGVNVSCANTTLNPVSPYFVFPIGMMQRNGVALPMSDIGTPIVPNGEYAPVFPDYTLDAEFVNIVPSYLAEPTSAIVTYSPKGFCLVMPTSRRCILLSFDGTWYIELKFYPQDNMSKLVLNSLINFTIDANGYVYLYGVNAPYVAISQTILPVAHHMKAQAINLGCAQCAPVAFGVR